MRPLVIFDGDDTLWFVEQLYDAARASVASYVGSLGLDDSRWDRLQRSIDVENVERFGLSRERFPTSCVEAFDQLAAEFGLAVTPDARRKVWRMASAVFDAKAELAIGAEDVLSELTTFADLVLLTKGDAAVQDVRIDQTGLRRFFAAVYVVGTKTETTFYRVLRDADVDPADAWSVGNSIPSDVNPALWLGMSAIWIDAHVWEHERREVEAIDGAMYTAQNLKEVVPIIREASRERSLQPA